MCAEPLRTAFRPLYKRPKKAPLPLPPVRRPRKASLGGRLSANTELLAPYLGFLSFQDCEKLIFVVYKAPSLWYFVQVAQTD